MSNVCVVSERYYFLLVFESLFKEGNERDHYVTDAWNYLDSSFYAVNWTSRRNYIIILLKGQMKSNNLVKDTLG